MTVSKARSWLYCVARLLGDVQAVRRGRVEKRIYNRVVGRAVGRVTRRLWR